MGTKRNEEILMGSTMDGDDVIKIVILRKQTMRGPRGRSVSSFGETMDRELSVKNKQKSNDCQFNGIERKWGQSEMKKFLQEEINIHHYIFIVMMAHKSTEDRSPGVFGGGRTKFYDYGGEDTKIINGTTKYY